MLAPLRWKQRQKLAKVSDFHQVLAVLESLLQECWTSFLCGWFLSSPPRAYPEDSSQRIEDSGWLPCHSVLAGPA